MASKIQGILDARAVQSASAHQIAAAVAAALTIPAPPSAATIADAVVAKAEFQILLSSVAGDFVFTPPAAFPGTGTLVLKNKAGTATLTTLALTFNAGGVATARDSQ